MPTEIKNLRKVAERIKKAIQKGEKIILYGDADLDGVTATILLKEAIFNLGGKVTAIYFPDREKEGYGITEIGLQNIKKFAPALLIALDLGIGNFKEIKMAKKMGFEIILIEHHQQLNGLPEADIIVNPKQKGDNSQYKYLATVGIVFKLAQRLFEKKIPFVLEKSFLELVALGTIADVMPREGENKEMIEKGLLSLRESWRPGILAFFKDQKFSNFNLNQKVSKLISLLNVRDIEKNLPASYRFLTAITKEKAKKILEILLKKNEVRKQKREKIISEIEAKIFQIKDPIVFEGSKDWDLILLGSIASIISQKYKMPTFLYKKGEKESQGTCRTPKNEDLVKAMKTCSEFLETFGGHAKAAGFRIKNEKLKDFKKCLIEYFNKFYEKNNHLH